MSISMPVSLRLLVAAGCVIAAQLPVWQMERSTVADASRAAAFDVSKLPSQLGSWTGVDTEIDSRLIRAIGASSVINRAYENAQGRQVLVHLAVFSTAEVSMPHSPTLCYKNAGWALDSSGPDRAKDGVFFRTMRVERDGARALIRYWYQLGEETAADRGELRRNLQNLRLKGGSFPPFVKVLLHAPSESSEDPADEDTKVLGKAIHDWIAAQS